MRIVIDVSTALRWVNVNAVGIVRTEREMARHFLLTDNQVELIYFDREIQNFIKVTKSQAMALFPGLSGNSLSIQENASDINSIFSFEDKDIVVSAGLQWDIEFLSAIYNKKRKQNIKFIQVIYDIIPILMPEYCVPGMDVLFPKFIMDAVWTSDVIFAISECTKNDFIDFAKTLQVRNIPPVHILNLGCDIPPGEKTKKNSFGLKAKDFILYVSTIEPRKNHKLLFDIWRSFDKDTIDNVPQLIFIGNKGWNTENFVTSLESCPRLYPDKITILNDVSDQDLEWLYANAQFTVYPSLYEGWGLPIAESLAHGTPCISSSSSSMPEVAGTFCDLIDPYDYNAWKRIITHYINNEEALSVMRKRITSNYKIQTWSMSMSKFKTDLDKIAKQWSDN